MGRDSSDDSAPPPCVAKKRSSPQPPKAKLWPRGGNRESPLSVCSSAGEEKSAAFRKKRSRGPFPRGRLRGWESSAERSESPSLSPTRGRGRRRQKELRDFPAAAKRPPQTRVRSISRSASASRGRRSISRSVSAGVAEPKVRRGKRATRSESPSSSPRGMDADGLCERSAVLPLFAFPTPMFMPSLRVMSYGQKLPRLGKTPSLCCRLPSRGQART